MKKIMGFKKDVELAKHLNIKPNTITSWKKRDSIPLNHLVSFCEKQELSLDYLFKGADDTYIKKDIGAGDGLRIASTDLSDHYGKKGMNGVPGAVILMDLARQILESNTEYSKSLEAGILSLHIAIKLETRLKNMEKDMASLKNEIANVAIRMERRNDKTKAQIRKDDPPEKKHEILALRQIPSL